MIKPEDLTDDMIREERRLAMMPDENGDIDDAMHTYCSLALGIAANGPSTDYQRAVSRDRIAESINARNAMIVTDDDIENAAAEWGSDGWPTMVEIARRALERGDESARQRCEDVIRTQRARKVTP